MGTTTEHKLEMLLQMFMIATIRPDEYDDIFPDNDFITRVLKKRLKACNLTIIIPNWLTFMCGYCMDGNPGYSLILFHEFLEKLNAKQFHSKGIPQDYKITTSDFANIYPNEFPIDKDKYEDIYDKNKKLGYNPCDTLDYWTNLFVIKGDE